MTRIEHDLLGNRAVPADAYWGIHTLRAVENFLISGLAIGQAPDLIRALAAIKQTAAVANADLGLLDAARRDAIVAACEDIRAGALHDQFIVDQIQGRAGTSTNMNANEVIANRALEIMGHPKGRYDLLHFNGPAVDDHRKLESSEVSVALIAVDGKANKDQVRDAEVAAIVARTWSAQVVATAARMNRDGAFEDAQKYIDRELRHFRRYVEGLPLGQDMVGELELLASRVGREFSSWMHKEMVVQSAMMMESRVDHRGAGKAAWSARMKRGD